MPRVRFTASPKLPHDWADKPYREGWEGEMSDDEAGRWMRRGVAEVVSPAATAPVKAAPVEPDTKPDPDPEEADEPEAEPPPEIPRDWRTHHHMARIALARRLTDDEVETAADADKVIADEVARRAAPAHHQV